MSDVNALLAQAAAAKDTLPDQSVAKKGPTFEVPPAGRTTARFIGYVETGMRKQRPYNGKEKPDAPMVRLYFELNGPKHQRTVEINGEQKTFTNTLDLHLTNSQSERSGFFKLFQKMAYGREDIKRFTDMLGEGFLVTVVHNVVEGKDGKPDRTYLNMKNEDGWLIGAPVIETHDEMTGEVTGVKKIPVPEMSQGMKMLLWDAPTKEQWDSIFIDGTRTVKEGDTEKEVSKNWLQEDIVQNAVDFDGSPLQALLGGVGDLDLEPEVKAPADEVIEADVPVEEPKPEPEPEVPATEEKAPEKSAGDILDELGL